MNTPSSIKAIALATLLSLSAAHGFAAELIHTEVASPSLIGSNALDSSDWMAEQFSVAAPTQIDSVLAYVLSNDSSNDLGKTFSIALYANDGTLPALDWWADSQGQLFHATATYNGDGWNGVSGLNWHLDAGSYWLALEQHGDATDAMSLQLPTGATPAVDSVAFYSGGMSYTVASQSDAFGLKINTVAAVPEPSSTALVLSSLGILGFVVRRRSR